MTTRDPVETVAAAVAVVGAGPAGIAAATRAAESGRHVIVLDQGLQVGGQIWRHHPSTPPPPAARPWIDRLARSGATVWSGASVVDALRPTEADGFLLTIERGGLPRHVQAMTLVLATGARERFLPFPGWTLPGVIGIGGAQALLKAGASFAGARVVIAGSGPLLLPVAASLVRAGAHLSIVAEQARRRSVARFAIGLWHTPATLAQAIHYRAAFRGARYAPGTWVSAADGDTHVRTATLTDGGRQWVEPCDALCTGYGITPNTELARLLGCATRHGAVVVDQWQATSVSGVYCAGEPTGTLRLLSFTKNLGASPRSARMKSTRELT